MIRESWRVTRKLRHTGLLPLPLPGREKKHYGREVPRSQRGPTSRKKLEHGWPRQTVENYGELEADGCDCGRVKTRSHVPDMLAAFPAQPLPPPIFVNLFSMFSVFKLSIPSSQRIDQDNDLRMRRIRLLSLTVGLRPGNLLLPRLWKAPSGSAAGEKPMYLECANPNCNCEYDYGRGRLFRFQQPQSPEKMLPNSHGVKHFWLCARCSQKHTIEFQKGVGVLLMERLEELADAEVRPSYCLLQPEFLPAPVAIPQTLLPRLSRSRARNRKNTGGRTTKSTKAIELLENRKLERR